MIDLTLCEIFSGNQIGNIELNANVSETWSNLIADKHWYLLSTDIVDLQNIY
jgi:hypothetical protein